MAVCESSSYKCYPTKVNDRKSVWHYFLQGVDSAKCIIATCGTVSTCGTVGTCGAIGICGTVVLVYLQMACLHI